MRHLIIMAMILLTGVSSLSLAQDGTSELPSPLEVVQQRQEEAKKTGGAAQPSPQKINADLLFRELDNLIPGDFEEGSAEQQAMKSVAEAFLAGRFKDVTGALEVQAKLNDDFPPSELLIAGLWYSANNAKQGQAFLEQAALKHPDYPGVFSAFARLAINQGRLTDAGALLEKTERLMASAELSDVEQKHFRGIFLDAMSDVAIRQRRFDDARKYVEEMQTLAPDTAKGLLAMAELEFQDDEISSSLAYLEKLKTKVPATRAPELILASWYQRKADSENTEKYINLAAKKYPEDSVVQIEFANFSVAKEDFQAARKAIEAIESRNGERANTLALKAKIAFAMQAFGLAESHYKKLVKLMPRDFDAANMYALSLIESGDEEKHKLAQRIAASNLKQLPNNPIAIAALGWIALKTGAIEQASPLLRRAAQAPRLAPEVAYYLATLMQEQKQSQQARLILEPAVKSEGFFLYRGPAKTLLAELEKGSSDFPVPKKD